MCVCSLTQASWEKRVLKSLNSMSTELGVPLARMVARLLSITANIVVCQHLLYCTLQNIAFLSCCAFLLASFFV